MAKKKFKHGFTLGKFMPPHKGHLHMIREAKLYVEKLTVLVCSVQREPIPGALRFEWMKELITDPNVTVIHVTDEVPSYPHEHPDFWNIWTNILRRYMHPDTQVFFSGENYGDEVAAILNLKHICIPRNQGQHQSSGTAIREKPFENWEFIPDVVRPYFVKRVALVGPESTGKTTMSQILADHFQTNWVEEYGREHFDKVQGKLTLEDISIIAKTQIEKEDVAAKKSNKLLFCDTDLIVTQIWSEIYFKECPQWIIEENQKRKYNLFLLMDIDLPWVDDGTREFPHLREFHFQRLKSELEKRALPVQIISGSFEERKVRAIKAIEGVLF